MSVNAEQVVYTGRTAGIRVVISEYPAGSNQWGMDIRKFFLNQNGERVLTKKGIYIPIETRNKDHIAIRVMAACTHALAAYLNVHPKDLGQRLLALTEGVVEQ